jgi:hypothetical protein
MIPFLTRIPGYFSKYISHTIQPQKEYKCKDDFVKSFQLVIIRTNAFAFRFDSPESMMYIDSLDLKFTGFILIVCIVMRIAKPGDCYLFTTTFSVCLNPLPERFRKYIPLVR